MALPSNQDSTGADAARSVNATEQATTSEPSPSDVIPRPFRPIKGIIATIVFVGLAIAAQTRDLLNDRSISNVSTIVTLSIAGLIILSMVIRWGRRRGMGWVVVPMVLLFLLSPLAMFRFRGFNGEMVPIFESRFRAKASLQQAVNDADKSDLPSLVAPEPFAQFLGPNRNAVLQNRQFAIPQGDAKERWRIAIGEGWSGFAVEGQYAVTLEQRDDRECVTCYRFADGALLWNVEDAVRHENPLGGVGPRSTPTISNGKVYTQGASGIVHCVDLATGKIVWKQKLLQLGKWNQSESEAAISWGRAASPLIVDDLCVIPFGRPVDQEAENDLLSGRSLIAFDALSGEIRWTAGSDQISYASPVLLNIANTPQIVSVNESSVTSHAPKDGTILWTIDWPGQSNGAANCSSVVSATYNQILIAKGYGIGAAVYEIKQSNGTWTPDEVWSTHRVLKTKFTHACVRGTHAYALSDGTLECTDLVTGIRKWIQSRGSRYGHGQVLLVDDTLIVQSESGAVAFVEATPDQYKEIATLNALNGRTWNTPAVSGNFLLVRNDTEAVLYELPKKP